MSVHLYEASVPVFLRYLERLRAWLVLASTQPEAQSLLSARLASDMHPFESQAAIACNFALRACFPLAGMPVPAYGEFEPGFAGLLSRVDHVEALLQALPREQFEGREPQLIEEAAGEARLSLPAPEFLLQYALPNFFFHLMTAYAILRQHGLALGKADFDGFHIYPPQISPTQSR